MTSGEEIITKHLISKNIEWKDMNTRASLIRENNGASWNWIDVNNLPL